MNSEREIQETVNALLSEARVTADVHYTGESVADDRVRDNWVFRLDGSKFSETFEYSTGTGHREKRGPRKGKPVTPHVAGLLYCVVADSAACDMSFANWCADYGYDTDSRKAFATYEACQQSGDKLKRLFTREQIKALEDVLQDY